MCNTKKESETIMTHSNDKYLWLPEDKFLLNLVKEYGSLAMLCPRIQSPYDLISWEHIKDSPLLQYKFVRDVKAFLKLWLSGKSLVENYKIISDMKTRERCDPGMDRKNYLPHADDISLMSHPPVLGHWLEQSGFITPDMKKQDHEYSFAEYEKIFNEATINKTRKRLFPTFEGILIHEDIPYYDIGTGSAGEIRADGNPAPENDAGGCGKPIIIKNNRRNLIWSTLHTISFDPNTGKFSKEELKTIKKYEDNRDFSSIEPNSVKSTYDNKVNYYTYMDGNNLVMRMFNDTTFSSRDENRGFFNTNIYDAYHMNFDLNSQFEISYPNPKVRGNGVPCGIFFEINYQVPREGLTKHKITSTSLAKQSYITGKILDRKSFTQDINYLSEINNEINVIPFKQENTSYHFEDCLDLYQLPINDGVKIKPQNNIINPKNEQELNEIRCKWNSYEIKPCDEIIRRDQSSFSSFEDYFNVYTQNIKISMKGINYYWFMYGALPVNNLLYTDLFNGLSMASKFMPDEDVSKNWSIEDVKTIYFDKETGSSMFYNKNNYVVSENEYPQMLKLNQDCIKFFSLIYGLSNIRISDHILNIKAYYTSNSSYSLMEKMEKFEILKHAYPKIMSANNDSIANEDKVEFVNRREITIPGSVTGAAPTKLILPEKMTHVDKSTAMTIMFKLGHEDVDLEIEDLQFLYSKGFMSGVAKEIYIKKIEPNKCKNKDSEDYKNLIKDIRSHKDLIETYIREVPVAENNEPTIPSDLKALDDKLKVANNLKNPIKIETEEKDNARAIKDYLTNSKSGKKIVSEKMLAYLVFLGLMNIDSVRNFKYVLSNKKKYLTDLTDTKYIEELNNFRAINTFEDSSFKTESIAPETPYIKAVFETKDTNTTGQGQQAGQQNQQTQIDVSKIPPNWVSLVKLALNRDRKDNEKWESFSEKDRRKMWNKHNQITGGGGGQGSTGKKKKKGGSTQSSPPPTG